MQVTELESKGLKKSLKVVVPATDINTQTEAELKAAGEQIKIPGFRPGFVPMKVLQQRYGKAVQADVIKHVINSATHDAIVERKLRPAMAPSVNIENYKEGGDLTFTLSFETFPDVPDISFNTLTLDRHTFEIGEKDIDEALLRVVSRSPKLNRAKEGSKAQLGQVVTIDFKGTLGGEAFDGGSASNFKLELGSKQFVDNFEEQLVGTKEGDDKIVTVTFPPDYPSEALAGKEATFSVKVKEIYSKESPQADDAFAKERGFADLAALRETIRTQLIKEYDGLVRTQLKKQLFDELEEAYDFEVPQGMLEMEFNTIWERLKEAKNQGDASVAGKSDEELQEEYQAITHRRVKLGIMLAELGNRHKIQVTREELMRAAMQQASMFPGQEKAVMEFYRNNPERIEDLRGPILEEKVVDFVLTQIKYADRNVTIDELMAISEAEEVVAKKSPKSKKESTSKAKSAPKKKAPAE